MRFCTEASPIFSVLDFFSNIEKKCVRRRDCLSVSGFFPTASEREGNLRRQNDSIFYIDGSCACAASFGKKEYRIRNAIVLAAIFLGLFAVSALRLNVGNDYATYVEHMHLINSKSDGWIPKVPEEEGFKALTYVIYKLCGFENYVLVFAIFAFLTVLFFMKGIWRQSKWFELSFAMFMLLGFYFHYY